MGRNRRIQGSGFRIELGDQMQTSRWSLRARAAMLAGVALAVTVAATAARAEDDLPDVKFFREILKGIGLTHDTNSIDYRERSPLVLPRDSTLPPPETKSAADQAPNWPVDDDLRRIREAKEAKAKSYGHSLEDEDHVLRPEELTPGRPGRPGAVYGSTTTPESSGKALTPSALGYVGGLFTTAFGGDKNEAKPFTAEPPRTALSDPPPGYQTPSPAQPYGLGKAKDDGKFVDPMDYYGERGGNPAN